MTNRLDPNFVAQTRDYIVLCQNIQNILITILTSDPDDCEKCSYLFMSMIRNYPQEEGVRFRTYIRGVDNITWFNNEKKLEEIPITNDMRLLSDLLEDYFNGFQQILENNPYASSHYISQVRDLKNNTANFHLMYFTAKIDILNQLSYVPAKFSPIP